MENDLWKFKPLIERPDHVAQYHFFSTTSELSSHCPLVPTVKDTKSQKHGQIFTPFSRAEIHGELVPNKWLDTQIRAKGPAGRRVW